MIYFEKENNTAYYEFNITADANSPFSDPLTLGSFLIFFDKKSYAYEPIPVSLADVKEANTILIKEDEIWGGTSDAIDKLGKNTEVLAPGNYAPMPHGEADQWVSNIGIIDKKLHIQIGNAFHTEFGSNDPSMFLRNWKGELVEAEYSLSLVANKENHILNVKKDDYADAPYKYQEFVFTLDEKNLKEYTLCFTGTVRSGVEGKWEVATNLSDTREQIRILKNDIAVDGYTFRHMTISPLGLQVIGSYKGDECMASEMSLAFETANGTIPLSGGGGGTDSQNKSFRLSWDTATPVDVAKITAVLINDVRIAVEK